MKNQSLLHYIVVPRKFDIFEISRTSDIEFSNVILKSNIRRFLRFDDFSDSTSNTRRVQRLANVRFATLN